MTKNPKNTCFNCRFEMSCGYSGLAQLGSRHEDVKQSPCCLGKKSDGKTFFQPKIGSPLWKGCNPEKPVQFLKIMKARGHAYRYEPILDSHWHLTDEGRAALGGI